MNAKLKNNKKTKFIMWLFSPFLYMCIMLVLAKYLKAVAIAMSKTDYTNIGNFMERDGVVYFKKIREKTKQSIMSQ